jgi:uncharacterized protein (TIGR02145 family)
VFGKIGYIMPHNLPPFLAACLTLALAFILSCSSGGKPQTLGSFTDTRDDKTYRTVKIGKQTWMAENLNYSNIDGKKNSDCYDNKEENCVKYGKLYRWPAAENACPVGWRLPTRKDWHELFQAVGGKETAVRTLKSKNGWSNSSGTDDFGFSALPGGVVDYDAYDDIDGDVIEFSGIGAVGIWRSSTQEEHGIKRSSGEYEADFWCWVMSGNEIREFFDYYYVGFGFSIRCVKN